ncbi:hypothetical protein [Streptomyces sp. NPDC046805]|uniref:hypothetical protein n=1 Tax=Streptomyces sp. NPDC046805 TaxID=3155134 RepID=UPI0033FF48F6
MSGGRHWNEDTQRWEDGEDTRRREDSGDAMPPAHGTGDGAWPPAASPPGAAPPSRPTAFAGYDRRTMWTLIGGAAAAGIVVSLVVTLGFGVGRNDDKHPAAASSSPAPTGPSLTAYPSDDATTDPSSPAAAEPPAGYTAYDDPQGFRIAVPDGWEQQRTTVDSQYGMDIVNYHDASGDRRLQVYEVAESSPSESFDLYLSSEVPKPRGFRELSLDSMDTAGFTGSRLEYVADSLKGEPDIGTWHVVDERFQAADGRLYAIASYGPDADGRADEGQVLDTALAWFCPPGADCTAPAAG